MKKKSFFFLFLAVFTALLSGLLSFTPESGASDRQDAREEWISMPAGAKSAYMGIHGGTMPVSLLVSKDGDSLFTFVGRTGNDFLELLRNTYLMALPSFANATRGAEGPLPGKIRPSLFAGNATATLPVISLSGDRLSKFSWFDTLKPFGLSEAPLSIEGEVAKPVASPERHPYRLFFLPKFFLPRGN